MEYNYMSSVKNNKKKCTRCQKELEVSNFKTYKKNNKIYYQSMCISCRKEYNRLPKTKESNRNTYEKNKEQRRLKNQAYAKTEKGKEARRRASKKYWDSNSIKNKARKKVRNAIRNGSMIRPSNCDVCGKTCKPEAHHHDYNKPLDVLWVCKECHTNIHYNN